jgi:hypothetical protein
LAREVRRFQVDFGIMPLISKRFCHRRSRQCVNNAPSKPAYSIFLGHEIGRELNTMSQWLDEHRDLLGLAACDLSRCAVKATGRQGLPAETVLRCALLKQYRRAELPGTGVPSGLSIVPRLCPVAVVVEPAKDR